MVAPNTTKTAWHSDTWRDSPMSNDRLAKTRTKPRVDVAVSNWEPLRRAGTAMATAVKPRRTGQGNRRPVTRRPVRSPAALARTTSWKNPLGEKTRTAKR